jgi:hypothetical protein
LRKSAYDRTVEQAASMVDLTGLQVLIVDDDPMH